MTVNPSGIEFTAHLPMMFSGPFLQKQCPRRCSIPSSVRRRTICWKPWRGIHQPSPGGASATPSSSMLPCTSAMSASTHACTAVSTGPTASSALPLHPPRLRPKRRSSTARGSGTFSWSAANTAQNCPQKRLGKSPGSYTGGFHQCPLRSIQWTLPNILLWRHRVSTGLHCTRKHTSAMSIALFIPPGTRAISTPALMLRIAGEPLDYESWAWAPCWVCRTGDWTAISRLSMHGILPEPTGKAISRFLFRDSGTPKVPSRRRAPFRTAIWFT